MGAPEHLMTPQPLNLSVALDSAIQQHLAASLAVVTEAEELVIDCAPMALHANQILRDLKARASRVDAMQKDIVGPIQLALANARKWFTPSLDAHAKAETIIKAKLQDFTRKESERIAEETRARQEAERRAREQADRDAAAARARAEEAARKLRDEAARAEAERLHQEAEARRAREAGDKTAAAAAEKRAQAAAAERARKEEEERQRLAEGARKAAEAELEAATRAQAAADVAPATERTAIPGYSERKNWTAEVDTDVAPDEDAAKALIVAAIAGGRRDLLSLLALDMKAAAKLAKAQEKNFSVPGLRARNRPVSASKG